MSYDRVLLDLDGTVYLGHGAVPGAADAITELRARGIRLAFVTNDPVSARTDYTERLGAIGIAVATDELVTCAWATAQLVAEEHPGARVLALGSGAWLTEHELAGLTLVDDYREAEVAGAGRRLDVRLQGARNRHPGDPRRRRLLRLEPRSRRSPPPTAPLRAPAR